ncbi:MAG: dihydroorotase [Kiritimatiellia bacterium]
MDSIRQLVGEKSWTLRGVRVLDPARGLDGIGDLYCVDGRLSDKPDDSAPVWDARGGATPVLAMPAAIDLHVHFRQPGNEAAETVETGLAAAAAGGFGTVVAMPNTSPALDSPAAIVRQNELAASASEKRVRYLLSACCTCERSGRAVAPLEALAEAGCVAFTDDGAMVADEVVMAEVMRRAAALHLPVMDHAVVPSLAGRGVIREGRGVQPAGAAIFPDYAEVAAVARDLRLAKETGARIHIQHLSCAESVWHLAIAQAEGVRATAEATPHHLLLCREEIPSDDGNWKMNPPLGTAEDRAVLRQAVVDGTIGCLATDHAPHTAESKARGFSGSPFGVIGLETALPATWKALVVEAGMKPLDWVARWTTGPASVLGMDAPSLAAGAPARVAVLSQEEWTPDFSAFCSRSRNCPFSTPLPLRVLALL